MKRSTINCAAPPARPCPRRGCGPVRPWYRHRGFDLAAWRAPLSKCRGRSHIRGCRQLALEEALHHRREMFVGGVAGLGRLRDAGQRRGEKGDAGRTDEFTSVHIESLGWVYAEETIGTDERGKTVLALTHSSSRHSCEGRIHVCFLLRCHLGWRETWTPAFAGVTQKKKVEGRKWGASVARCSPNRRIPLLLPGADRTALSLSNVVRED